eukprot:SAG11_NODE_12322_length_709_cov_0.896721_1_plen_57_part_10
MLQVAAPLMRESASAYGNLALDRLRSSKREHEAASKIQAAMRGRTVRKNERSVQRRT